LHSMHICASTSLVVTANTTEVWCDHNFPGLATFGSNAVHRPGCAVALSRRSLGIERHMAVASRRDIRRARRHARQQRHAAAQRSRPGRISPDGAWRLLNARHQRICALAAHIRGLENPMPLALSSVEVLALEEPRALIPADRAPPRAGVEACCVEAVPVLRRHAPPAGIAACP
jgi:hypothetical protein